MLTYILNRLTHSLLDNQNYYGEYDAQVIKDSVDIIAKEYSEDKSSAGFTYPLENSIFVFLDYGLPYKTIIVLTLLVAMLAFAIDAYMVQAYSVAAMTGLSFCLSVYLLLDKIKLALRYSFLTRVYGYTLLINTIYAKEHNENQVNKQLQDIQMRIRKSVEGDVETED